MRKIVILCILLSVVSCKKQLSEEALTYLNGYWEIEAVEFPNGSTKEYTISTTIDYISLTEMAGYRKKVYPQLNGKYKTSDDAEQFSIYKKDGVFFLVYGKNNEQWEEQLMAIDETSFSVKNNDQKIYHYKKFDSFNLIE